MGRRFARKLSMASLIGLWGWQGTTYQQLEGRLNLDDDPARTGVHRHAMESAAGHAFGGFHRLLFHFPEEIQAGIERFTFPLVENFSSVGTQQGFLDADTAGLGGHRDLAVSRMHVAIAQAA